MNEARTASGCAVDLGAEFMNYFDVTYEVFVQFRETSSRNPPLRVQIPADLVNWIPIHERLAYLESRDESSATVPNVPIARDLNRIRLVRDLIEDRLFGQPWGPPLEARCLYEFKLRGASRPVERNRGILLRDFLHEFTPNDQ